MKLFPFCTFHEHEGTMTKFAVIFTAIAVSILIDKVNSAQSKNIQNFLQSLQQQLQQEQQRKEHQNSNRLQQVAYHPSGGNAYGSLKNQYLEKSHNHLSNDPSNHHSNKRKQQNDRTEYYTQNNPNSKVNQLIDSLLGLDDKNDITISSEPNDRDQATQNEYSKVYVVLNSEAIKRSKNKDKLNQLLSNLLVSAPQHEKRHEQHHHERHHHDHHHHHNRERKFHVKADHYLADDQRDRYHPQNNLNREDDYFLTAINLQDDRNDRDENNDKTKYKGFLLQTWNRRRGSGEADERYDKKAMRGGREKPRGGRERGGRGSGRSGGGGGGSGNSHTAIPYIRQHGDIYERDN